MTPEELGEDILAALGLCAQAADPELALGRLWEVEVKVEPCGFLWKIEGDDGGPFKILLAPVWETLPRIERLEVLSYCLLRCAAAFTKGRMTAKPSAVVRAAKVLGICPDPVQTVVERLRRAQWTREYQKPYPIDEYESRPACHNCGNPIGSWDRQFLHVGLHHHCAARLHNLLRQSLTSASEPTNDDTDTNASSASA